MKNDIDDYELIKRQMNSLNKLIEFTNKVLKEREVVEHDKCEGFIMIPYDDPVWREDCLMLWINLIDEFSHPVVAM